MSAANIAATLGDTARDATRCVSGNAMRTLRPSASHRAAAA